MADQVLRIKDSIGNIHDLAYQDSDGTWALLTTDQDLQAKFAPVTHAGAIYTTSGDHPLVTTSASEKVILTWYYVQAGQTNTTPVEVTVKLGATEVAKFELDASQPMAHGAVYVGALDADLIVNTNNTQKVYVNCDYRLGS